MDFGEILKQWDKKTAFKTKVYRAGHAFEHKKEDEADKPVNKGLTRREAETLPIEARIDLHGLTTMEADIALSAFFDEAERLAYRKILIVHGKGLHSSSEPVLEPYIKQWLERRPSAGRTGHPDAANGGKGATWVILKKTDAISPYK